MASRARARSPHFDRRVGQPRPGLSQAARVLPPHSAAVGAGEAPQAYQQVRGPPPHRHVGQTPGHCPTSLPLGAAGSAEGVLESDRHTALDHRTLGCEVLAHSGQSQGIQAQEGRQIRVGEGSLRHVEVSRDGCLAAPIIEGPRPLPKQRLTRPPRHTNKLYLLHTQTRRAGFPQGVLRGWCGGVGAGSVNTPLGRAVLPGRAGYGVVSVARRLP